VANSKKNSITEAQRQKFEDSFITHNIYLQRYAANLANYIVTIIDGTEGDLLKILETSLERFGVVAPTKKTLEKFDKIQRDVYKLRSGGIIKAQNYVTDELVELAHNEAVFAKQSTEYLLDDIALKAPSKAILESIVTNGVYAGSTIEQMFKTLAVNDTKRIMQHVRNGMTQGLTTESIVRGISGTAKMNYKDGILNITRNEARTIARTSTNGVANSAKMSMYLKNTDVITGVKFSAVLDGRTSLTCASVDGSIWKLPEEAGEVLQPPLHHNCRSSLVPEVKGFENMDYKKPAANKDFMAREKGWDRRWKDLSSSTRKKYYYKEIQATPEPFRQVSSKTTFPEYFERQPESFKRDYLGPTRYELYKEGNLKLDKFVSDTGRPLTVQQLEQANQNIFKEIDLGSSELNSLYRVRSEDGFVDTTYYRFDDKDPFVPEELEKAKKAASEGPDSFVKYLKELKKADANIEWGASFTSQETPFAVGRGNKQNVYIAIPNKNGITIHNHPDGSFFSKNDIIDYLEKEVQEAILISNNQKYVLKKVRNNDIMKAEDFKKTHESLKIDSEKSKIIIALKGSGYEIKK